MAYLELQNLSKHFTVRRGLLGETSIVKAVDDVSLEIERGEILGLVGESGCGKSTLSRVVMQLIPPTDGRVVLDGIEMFALTYDKAAAPKFIWKKIRERRKRREKLRRMRLDFQMIFQDPYASLNPRMTVFSTLAEAVRQRHPDLAGNGLVERVSELMNLVGLEPKYIRKYPHEFSGGQRQRIAIARALAPEPKLIIADEPVSALDVSIQSQILNLLRKLQRELKLTMIFISHDLAVVRYIADRIAVMEDGKIVEIGPADEVFENPQNEYTRTLLKAIPRVQF